MHERPGGKRQALTRTSAKSKFNEGRKERTGRHERTAWTRTLL
jgi:hypothetical protein